MEDPDELDLDWKWYRDGTVMLLILAVSLVLFDLVLWLVQKYL